MATDLTGKQRVFLRGLAHDLSPVVLLGKEGVHETVTNQVEAALARHELIKLKALKECPVSADEAAAALAAGTRAAVVQRVGRVIVLYRRKPKEPRIRLPGEAGGAAGDAASARAARPRSGATAGDAASASARAARPRAAARGGRPGR